LVAKMKDPNRPASRPEVYAREQIYLHDEPQRELVLQAIRVGELGITAIPNEVFGLTGLKLKAQSPLVPTFNIELANGAEGYIPPPEQHELGGYTTWPARTAGLEVQAEPKIVETLLELLEKVAGKPRRKPVEAAGPYTEAVLASKPIAYWRLGEMAGREARNTSPGHRAAQYMGCVALYLEGPAASGLLAAGQVARAAHFAGGRVVGVLPDLGPTYTFEAWFWNGLPADARPVTGWLFSWGSEDSGADLLGVGGTAGGAGRLFFSNGGAAARLAGGREIGLRTWNHVAVVRDGRKLAVFLNGQQQPEIAGEATPAVVPGTGRVIIGGRSDGQFGFEGKISEVALFGRALGADEIARHYAAAGTNS
jgi:hypothetical protein